MSGTNPLLQETNAYNKNEIPLQGLQRAFDKEFGTTQDQWNFDLDGYPAWKHLHSISINASFSQYLVPVFKAEDDRVKAIIIFTHYLDHGVVDVEYVYREKVKRYPAYNSLRLVNKNENTLLKDHTMESLVVKFSALDQRLFGNTYDDQLSLLDDATRSQFYNKDCQITTHYLLLECQDVVGGGQVLYTDCNAVGTETIVTVVAGCDGGTGGPGNPGPSGPITGGSGTGVGVSVVNTDPNSSDNRCIEDGVGCDEEDFDVSLLEDTPGDKPLDVFDDKCNGLAGLWNRSSGAGNPEVFGVLTRGGNFLVTQTIGAVGGQVNGLYSQTDAVTGVETTYYFYPTSAGGISLPGDNVVNNGTYYFIPISATIHSHSPCIADGTDGISNRTVGDDQTLAISFPGVRHYILGCGAIGQFSHTSATPFNIQHGDAPSLCGSFN